MSFFKPTDSTTYAQWVVAHSRKIKGLRNAKGEYFCLAGKPSTAELRRWLRSKDTPKHIKKRIYDKLLYRRGH